MPQSLARVYLHTVFSTKYRQPFIDRAIEGRLHDFLRARLWKMGSQVEAIGGVEDHVHLLYSQPRTTTIAKVIEQIKSLSSKWIKSQGPQYHRFGWQKGYGTFSVDYRRIAVTRRYIENQRVHHSRRGAGGYRAEILAILTSYEVEYDPIFLFDEPPLPR